MRQAAFTDAAVAYDDVTELVLEVADQRAWSSDEREEVLADVDQAYEDADAAAWWGYDVRAFWESLARSSHAWSMTGAEKLADVVNAALVAVGSEEERAEAQSASTIVGGAVEGSASDYADAARATGQAVTDPKYIAAAAVLAMAVLAIVVKVR